MVNKLSLYNDIISSTNLFCAWKDFRRGKSSKIDVMEFEFNLEQNIFSLHRDLHNRKYKHGAYSNFHVIDPKQRHIHKAMVRDRVVHHAIYNKLYKIFNTKFIGASFSCRKGKGTHRGVEWLYRSIRKVSKNYTKKTFVLKCDVRKFFDSVDHSILVEIIKKRIKDKNALFLLEEIISSFQSSRSSTLCKKGLPLGNLTSQIFANIYMNEFDQYIKRELKIKYYARYTDDFVIVSNQESELEAYLTQIRIFLFEKLKLELHPNKVSIGKIHNGVDFLGYISFPHHKLLRIKTKNRVFNNWSEMVEKYKKGRVEKDRIESLLYSYLGTLSHADTYLLKTKLKNSLWMG